MDNWSFGKQADGPEWPLDENGEKEQAVFLEAGSGFELDLEMTVTMLRAYGIPAMVKYPGDGSFGRVVLGFSGYGADIYVPRSMAEDARELLQAAPEPEENIE